MKTIVKTLAKKLNKHQEVQFKHKRHFIYIQQQSDAEYKGDIHYSKIDYKPHNILNGAICITLVPKIANRAFYQAIR
ncbi:MAG: hypothetical protein C0627_11030 [Sulfurimonas sp.]|nr:MAG: hypothetical protein C0627_11030 [Sulfurimonas sp.]